MQSVTLKSRADGQSAVFFHNVENWCVIFLQLTFITDGWFSKCVLKLRDTEALFNQKVSGLISSSPSAEDTEPRVDPDASIGRSEGVWMCVCD